ncbi:MAG: hypothetical protein ABSG41_28700 [Bryobacteraceae bacterium]|jgi:hypothetical protein
MTVLLTLFLLLAAPVPASLDQVRAETDPERRAKAAIDFAATAERNAEAAFSNGNVQDVVAQLNTMKESMEMTRDSLVASRKTPGRNPKLYKYFELRSHELLMRLEDFERRMFLEERDVVAVPKARVQEIHDFWFEGIMGRRK